ncbi:hypothetical protein [Nonomuraea sp. LPB2021202275-12-8]|uniref:hypothetical protein n=1 Tax=Nonomuraea sp. LPB2021202275-12-8 TaxID=3120159 RepID=UPI00300D5F2A
MDIPPASTPIVCDMADAPDTAGQRLEEYQRLLGQTLVSREKTGQGIRFRLRADPGVLEWVRDLAAREKACCAFFAFEVTVEGEEVLWDWAVSDDDVARALLEEVYLLPGTATRSLAELDDRLAGRGLRFTADLSGVLRHVTD